MDTRIILIAAGALVMAACSSNDPEVQGNAGEIHLRTEVSAPTRATDNPVALQDEQFAENTDISVMVTDKGNLSTTLVSYPLTTYRADGAGGLTPVTTQYYPASGNNVEVCAYHPAGAPVAFTVAADQQALGDYRASDLMWAQLESINKETDAEHRVLMFHHLCSKIVIRLVKGNGVTDAEMAAATITLTGGEGDDKRLIMGGTFGSGDGTLTPDPNVTGTMTIATYAGTAPYAAVVIPQDMGGKKITVALGGGTQSYTIPATSANIFEPGMKYAYTVTVNKAELVVTATIEDWTTPDGWVDPTPNIKI
jgi:hypothetical protein